MFKSVVIGLLGVLVVSAKIEQMMAAPAYLKTVVNTPVKTVTNTVKKVVAPVINTAVANTAAVFTPIVQQNYDSPFIVPENTQLKNAFMKSLKPSILKR